MCQQLRMPTRNAVRRIKCCRPAHPRRNSLSRPGKHAHRHRFHNLPPVLPVMKLRQIVRPHQPDKPHLRVKPAQLCQGLRRVPRPDPVFYVRDLNAGVLHHVTRMGQPFGQWRWPVSFQRIARRHQPPHPIQPEPFEGLTGDMRMPGMGRVKRPPQQADDLPRCCIWKVMAQKKRPPSYLRGRSNGHLGPLSILIKVLLEIPGE